MTKLVHAPIVAAVWLLVMVVSIQEMMSRLFHATTYRG